MNPKRKLLVTGAQGFVAGSVLAQAGADWEVHAVSRSEPPRRTDRVTWHTCDSSDPESWAMLFRTIKPHALVHTAAIADIDFAEKHRELAWAANVELTRTLAAIAEAAGCRFVFCSTDTVFDGEHAPYREEDGTGPVNYYAETKVEAERMVQRLGARAVIARLALVVGLPVLGAGNSLLARMLGAFAEGRSISVPEREVRTPVDVITAGRALLELAAGQQEGTFHLAGKDRLNRLEIARRIAVRFGHDSRMVAGQEPAVTPGRAVRPRDVSLDNTRARTHLRTPMLTFDEGLSLIQETRFSS